MTNVPQASHDSRDVNVGIAGAGRIGGGLINAVADMGHPFDISTVVDVVSPETLKYRLKRDSAGSGFDGEIRVEGEKNGGRIIRLIRGDVDKTLTYFQASQFNGHVPWKDLGVDYAVDATGMAVNNESIADSHLVGGAKRLLITAPSSLAGVQSVIYGVNHGDYNGGRIVDNASCTTKAAASPLKFLRDQFGVRSVHLRTVHAALPGMSPVDTHRSPGKATDDTLLKGRGLLGNVVPGSTGAARGLVRVFSDLEGRMDAQALNVPLMNGSLITLNVRLARDIPGSTPTERVQYLQDTFRQYIDGVLPPDLLGYKVMDMEQPGDPLTLLDVAQMKHPPDAMINRRSIVSLLPDEVGLDAWYNNELSSVHGTARMIPFLANYDRHLAARESAVRSVA